MRKLRMRYVLIGLLLFVILGKTVSVNADEDLTNVNGESQGQMRVTGTLGKPEINEPEEELPSKENPEPTRPTHASEQKSEILATQLPKTGESTNYYIGLIGVALVFGVGQIYIKFSIKKEPQNH